MTSITVPLIHTVKRHTVVILNEAYDGDIQTMYTSSFILNDISY